MSQGPKLLLLALLLTLLGYVSYKTFAPQPAASATSVDIAPTCPNGTMACPNNCLKREAEGWVSMNVKGHPDTDIWMSFGHADGHWEAFNQGHIGHVIELQNGKYTDTGVCPVCRGTTRVCKAD